MVCARPEVATDAKWSGRVSGRASVADQPSDCRAVALGKVLRFYSATMNALDGIQKFTDQLITDREYVSVAAADWNYPNCAKNAVSGPKIAFF
jgi:hypothetical protein